MHRQGRTPNGRLLARHLAAERLEPRVFLSVTPLEGDFAVPEGVLSAAPTGPQQGPALATDTVGNHVVAWAAAGEGGSSQVFAQRYSVGGGLAGGKIEVSDGSTSARFADVAMEADGDFVVAWSAFDGAGGGYEIFARRYDASGTATTEATRVNTLTVGSQSFPAIAVDDDGDTVVVYSSDEADGSGTGIVAQRFDATLAAVGSEIIVNAYTDGSQRDPAVASTADGGFVVTWTSPGQDGSGSGVFGQRFDTAGHPVGGVDAIQEITFGGSVTGGTFTLRYGADETGPIAYTADGNGQVLAAAVEAELDALVDVTVAATDATRLVVTFGGASGSADHSLIKVADASALEGTGATATTASVVEGVSGEFGVATTTDFSQELSAVAASAAGGFVVSWQSFALGDGWQIRAQAFDANAGKAGGELLVGLGRSPRAVMDEHGNFLVTWEAEDGIDGDGWDVYSRYHGIDNGLHAETDRLNEATAGDQRYASPAMVPFGNRLLAVWADTSVDGTTTIVSGRPFGAIPEGTNKPPEANDDSYLLNEDSATTALLVLSNDTTLPDVGETLRLVSVSAPSSGGAAEIVGDTIRYTPGADFFGEETFEYVVDDGTDGNEATATVTVFVSAINDPPTAGDDALTVEEDSSANLIDLLANDTFLPDADETLTVVDYGVGSAGGVLELFGENLAQYTPADDFFGTETFVYTVNDGTPGSDATATVTFEVTPVDDPPTVMDDAFTVSEDSSANVLDVLANDSIFPDVGEQLVIIAVTPGSAGGTVQLVNGVWVEYTPPENFVGEETFRYWADDGNNHSGSFAEVTVSVENVNDPPRFDSYFDDIVLPENSGMSAVFSASDLDVGDTLSFSMETTAPPGLELRTGVPGNPGGGYLDWNPEEADGPGLYQVTLRVTDNGNPPLTDEQTFFIEVLDVNEPPFIEGIPNQFVNEQELLEIQVVAEDPDSENITFSLDDPPEGAVIDSVTGLFRWTPAEEHGPGTHEIFVRATDDGDPVEFHRKSFRVFVDDVNQAPVVEPIPNQAVAEGTPLVFTAVATDPDPFDSLTFSLGSNAPAGTFINPQTGAFAWTPTEDQGPGNYFFAIRATDNGSPEMFHERNVLIQVTETNNPPAIDPIADVTLAERTLLSFVVGASDPDPSQQLSFQLDAGAPEGAAVHATTGIFSWTPNEDQGPGDYPITVRASDNGDPALATTETFVVTVTEDNQAPVIEAVADQVMAEGTTLEFDVVASDADVPVQTLIFTLDAGAPQGAVIDPITGRFSWAPSVAQGAGSYPVTVRVTDDGEPAVSATESFLITITDVNQAPVFVPVGDQAIDEGESLAFVVEAVDLDGAANGLTYSLAAGAPEGAAIHPQTGLFTWTPTEAQGPGTFAIGIEVTDDGEPQLADAMVVTVEVREVNLPPVIAPLPDRSAAEGEELTITVVGSDPDLPQASLVYSLDPDAPTGAAIDPVTGVFRWTPTESQTPAAHTVTFRVTDSGNPALSATETITIATTEVNQAPSLAPINDKTVAEGAPISFTVTAFDADLPGDALTYRLGPGAPVGAAIDPNTGVFSWSPNEFDGPDEFPIEVIVTDAGNPPLSDSQTFTIGVSEVNSAPVVEAIPPQQVSEHAELVLTVAASDPDVPSTPVAYFLEPGAPLGATIDETTGEFRWTPGEVHGPAEHTIAVRVTDGGVPELNTIEVFTITVAEANQAPELAEIDNLMSLPGAPATFTASATDPDAPAQGLSFSLGSGAPAGASIDPVTGAFQWTPTAEQAGVHAIDVLVTDDGPGELTDQRTFFVQVMSLSLLGGFDWGNVDFIDVGGQEILGLERYRFETVRSGLLTLEAMFDHAAGNVDLALVDGDGNEIATSATTGGHERIDAVVEANEPYTLIVTGDNADVRLRMTNLVTTGNSHAEVFGTYDDDAFVFIAGATHRFSINGTEYSYLDEHLDTVRFQGGLGNDLAALAGGDGDETVTLMPGAGTMSATGYAVDVVETETIRAASVVGNDVATITGSSGAESVDASSGDVTHTGDGFLHRVAGFASVNVHGGAEDIARLYGTPGDDSFFGNPEYAEMTTGGFRQRVTGIATVHAYGVGGFDRAVLWDSLGDDTVLMRPDVSRIDGPGYVLYANEFDEVRAYRSVGNDVVKLYDSAGVDVFFARPDFVEMSGAGYYNYAKNFEVVRAYSSHGDDEATFWDSAGDDAFFGRPDFAQLTGTGFFNYAKGFPIVRAFAGGGLDRATFWDSTGDDAFFGRPDFAQLEGENYFNWVKNFDEVRAYAGGGTDTALFYDSAGDDVFTGQPDSAELTGAGYYNYVKNFDEARAVAGGGNDRAMLLESSGGDTLSGDAGGVTFGSHTFSNRAENFDTVEAYGGTAYDLGLISGSDGDDLFDLSLTGSGTNAAATLATGATLELFGFREIDANGGDGSDRATIQGSHDDDDFYISFSATGAATASIVGPDALFLLFEFEDIEADGGSGSDTAVVTGSDSDDIFDVSFTGSGGSATGVLGTGSTLQLDDFLEIDVFGADGNDELNLNSGSVFYDLTIDLPGRIELTNGYESSTVRDFEDIEIDLGHLGGDVVIQDSAGADAISGRENWLRIDSGGVDIVVTDLDSLEATSSAGGADTADFLFAPDPEAVDYVVDLFGPWL